MRLLMFKFSSSFTHVCSRYTFKLNWKSLTAEILKSCELVKKSLGHQLLKLQKIWIYVNFQKKIAQNVPLDTYKSHFKAKVSVWKCKFWAQSKNPLNLGCRRPSWNFQQFHLSLSDPPSTENIATPLRFLWRTKVFSTAHSGFLYPLANFLAWCFYEIELVDQTNFHLPSNNINIEHLQVAIISISKQYPSWNETKIGCQVVKYVSRTNLWEKNLLSS